MAGKKRAKSAKEPSNWDNLEGWKPVEVGEEFLLGSEEYGFMGLEELDPSALGECSTHIIREIFIAEPPTGPDAAADAPPPKKKTKTKKTKEVKGPESVDELKARLAALEAENKALRKGEAAATNGNETPSDKKNDKAKKTAEKKKEKEPAKPKQKAKKGAKSTAAGAEKTEEEAVPMVDVSAWDDFQLDSQIMGALSKMGFSAPTHVQAECIPAAIRDRRDVIGAAQTGSGKTLAFGLPIIHLICQGKTSSQPSEEDDQALENPAAAAASPLRALILAPTRELAMQVCSHLQAVGKHCGVWAVPIVGGISAQKQERLLKKHPEIIVATPGRLWDLMREGHPHVANLNGLKFLVIDEADRMVQQGHYAELTSILDAIPAAREGRKKDQISDDGGDEEESAEESDEEEDEMNTGSIKKKKGKKSSEPPLQTFVFSATLTLPGDMRKRLRKGGGGASGSATLESLMDKVPLLGRGKPKVVDLTSERKVADKISEACISCPEAERDEYLYCLLASHPGRTIVFVNAISAVRRLAAILKTLGLPVHALHAQMQQRARLKALDRFKGDANGILVATDVAARGLDIKDVRCVVHYQLPASLDVYVHRSGRTARAEAEGIAIALVTPKEDARYRALLRALGRAEPPSFPLDASLMKGARERVRLAVRLDSLDRSQSKEKAELSWRRQHAEELEIELSDDSEDEKVQGKRVGKKARKEREDVAPPGKKGEAEKVRAELGALLAEPLQPKFSKKFFTGGAASGVAMQQAQQTQQVKAAKGTKGAKGAAATAAAAAEDNGARATVTVSKAVSMAQQLSDSRIPKKNPKGGAAAAAGAKTKAKAPMSRAAALAAAVRKQVQKKAMKGGQRRGMVVVNPALGRVSQGPDALQALRNRQISLAADK